MRGICRLNWGQGLSKLINTKTISTVYQDNKKLTITYNYNTSNGLIIFGSGFINQEPHSETLHFENSQEASIFLDKIQASISEN